jgi:predicted HicB family RNase H-like nuclease
MMNVLKHKGYQARVEFDGDDEIFVGRIAGIDDNVSFHADSVDGLVAAFQEAVEDYLETCEKIGKPPEKSYSGNIFLRVDEEIHAKVAMAAELLGKSLNEFGEEVLRQAVNDLFGESPLGDRLRLQQGFHHEEIHEKISA